MSHCDNNVYKIRIALPLLILIFTSFFLKYNFIYANEEALIPDAEISNAIKSMQGENTGLAQRGAIRLVSILKQHKNAFFKEKKKGVRFPREYLYYQLLLTKEGRNEFIKIKEGRELIPLYFKKIRELEKPKEKENDTISKEEIPLACVPQGPQIELPISKFFLQRLNMQLIAASEVSGYKKFLSKSDQHIAKLEEYYLAHAFDKSHNRYRDYFNLELKIHPEDPLLKMLNEIERKEGADTVSIVAKKWAKNSIEGKIEYLASVALWKLRELKDANAYDLLASYLDISERMGKVQRLIKEGREKEAGQLEARTPTYVSLFKYFGVLGDLQAAPILSEMITFKDETLDPFELVPITAVQSLGLLEGIEGIDNATKSNIIQEVKTVIQAAEIDDPIREYGQNLLKKIQ